MVFLIHIIFTICLCTNTQNDSGVKVNILEGNTVRHCEEKFRINVGLILNGNRNRALLISRPLLIFLCGVWSRAKFTEGRWGTSDELHSDILNAAASTNKREDKQRRTTRDLRTRVAKCTEVDGGNIQKFILNCNKDSIKYYVNLLSIRKNTICKLMWWLFGAAEKSLARPGRKQARKFVRHARDFNKIETRAVSKIFFPCKTRRRRKFTPFWQKH